MSNVKSNMKWEEENNELQKQLLSANKLNRDLKDLVDSQRRLIAKYRKEIDDLNLLLSVKVEKINEK